MTAQLIFNDLEMALRAAEAISQDEGDFDVIAPKSYDGGQTYELVVFTDI